MNIIHKRKQTTFKSLKQTIKSLQVGDVWCYGTGKLNDDQYHALPYLSAHVIKDLANKNLSDYYLWRKFVKRDLEQPDSAKFLFGRAFHTAVLEPKLFDGTYVVQPKFDRRTKQGKADAAEWDEANQGKQVITQDQLDGVDTMSKAVRRNPYAKAVMKGASVEVSGFTRLANGHILRGRIDGVHFDARYGFDLKSAEDVSPAGFAKAAANFRYDIQAYTYMQLFGLDEFIFVVCSKKEPYEVAIYTLNDEYMEKAAEDFEQAVLRWERINSMTIPDSFTNDNNPMITLAPPAWFKYQ